VKDDLEKFHERNVADDPQYAAAYRLFDSSKIKIDIIKPAQGGQRGLALMNSRF